MKTTTNKTTQTKANEQTTETRKSNFENLKINLAVQLNPTTRTSEQDYYTALIQISKVIVYNVLNKCIDVSQNKTLIQTKIDVTKDTKLLDNTRTLSNTTYKTRYNQNGEIVTEIADKELNNAFNNIIQQTLGEGIDLVDDASIAILQEYKKATEENRNIDINWIDTPYTIRRLKRKVWIKIEDSENGWETVETTPIQEIYKAVRRSVENSRAIKTDPKNGYCYLTDLVKDSETGTEEEIYRRLPKYANLGGYATDFNGKETSYTTDKQTVSDIDTLTEKLNLSKQQATILQLRLSGYGYKAIATYLSIDTRNVLNQIKRIQAKATAIGLQPCTK